MTSRDFITAEATNTDRIILYREGLFWKAYERSAYALCSQVRPLKPTRKVLKVLDGGDLISVGFPTASESAVLSDLERLEETSDRLVVAAPQRIDDEAFGAWKASVPVKVSAPRKPVDPVAEPSDTASDGIFDCERSASGSASDASAASGSVAAASGDPATASVIAGSAGSGAGFGSDSSRFSWLRRMLRAFRSCNAPTGCGEFSPEDDTARRIVRSLKDFNLADKTPMECMLFISELKNMLVNR